MKKRESFADLINSMAPKYGAHAVFSDFLTLVICAFSHGTREKEYMEVIDHYEKPEAYTLSHALGALVIEMTGEDGNGFIDVLGDYFQEFVTHGHNGQFFTPQSICDLMARINNPVKASAKIADPACGSGRTLLAMAKINRFAMFYGADIDQNCAKMTTINLCLNNLYGEVACMDSLSNQFYVGWQIQPTISGAPRIVQICEKQSYIHLKLPEKKPTITPVPFDFPDVLTATADIPTNTPQQQLIFEF